MKVAILDLGTNVFNLLVTEIADGQCRIIKVVKIPSFIGAGGFKTGRLSEEAMSKSMEALEIIKNEIDKVGEVSFVRGFATSAFRDADNGSVFAECIRDRFGFEVEIISGDREAELIYKGIRESIFIWREKVLMCDIGGGSNELIIAGNDRIYWKKSFNLGVLRLREYFSPGDPMSQKEIVEVEDYLNKELQPLFDACAEHCPKLMIGSSGSFDTLRELIYTDDDGMLPAKELEMDKLGKMHSRLLASDREERMRMPRMSPIRVDYMVLGSIFIQLVISGCNIKEVYQSSYSLKEGYMAELAGKMNEKIKN